MIYSGITRECRWVPSKLESVSVLRPTVPANNPPICKGLTLPMSINVTKFQLKFQCEGKSRTKAKKKKKNRGKSSGTPIPMVRPIAKSRKCVRSSRTRFAKNASAGLLNAYSRTLALSCKVGGGNGDGVESAGDDRAGCAGGAGVWVVRVTRGVARGCVAVQRRGSKRRVKRARETPGVGGGLREARGGGTV